MSVPKYKIFVNTLLKKSEESLLLALEIYNKPTINYRLEAFSIFFINAWELLLKAKIVDDAHDKQKIFLKNKKDTISLDTAIRKIFQSPHDGVRKNIEHIAEIRHSSIHLIISELDDVYLGLFQQGIFNYVNFLKDWFNKSINISPRLMTIVLEFNPSNVRIGNIKSKYGEEIAIFFEEKRNKIKNSIEQYNNKSSYSIPIEYKLALVKDPKNADFKVAIDKQAKKGLIIEIPKDSSKTHPFLTKNIHTILKKEISHYRETDLYALNLVEDITQMKRPEFLYINSVGSNPPKQYSQKYIDFVKKKLINKQKVSDYRKQYKLYLNKKNGTIN